jgi:hypothetical protein
MEDITRLVDALLARYGIKASSDVHLSWSRWFRCLSNASMLLAPGKPGILALAEEANSPRASLPRTSASSRSERMLALFQVTEADDLGIELARLFRPGNPARRRLDSGRCFARYAVVEDPVRRSAACSALHNVLKVPDLCVMEGERVSSGGDIAVDFADAALVPEAASPSLRLTENRELWETVRRPAPLPSGF